MDFGLADKTALVTGGAGRIGSEDCRVLADEGAAVVVLDVDADAAAAVADEIESNGGDAITAECDLTDREAVRETVETVREATGGVDILVNNAAFVDAAAQVGEFDDDVWDRDVAVNLTGAYNITKEVFPAMCERGWGRVISMSSMAGLQGGFGQASYSATKAALIGLGKTLALEGAQHGVTSNVIVPNIVVDEFADLSGEELEAVNPMYERIRQATPMKELGREEDVSFMVAYLASQQARYVTGQAVGVTGGVDLFSF
ncbi:SDR family oxidoreductase [Halosegnis rubeus]|jgi:NAD(P)-dependent dehydrogenase (short-subunit alcohol dehydrogenase family)|uniref:SDR family NAD(P)-dependent oxidoreductase n=1 Tax=Halosegnis rubeus TaxID=2212850 RepID=A0A5N5UER1_9EURY|nr:SDR family NAD(P)-dependent oxidoreductase [Halosegnis rubeus]KAB7516980.1 SDR family NAD(P)-dependent oxidoreductase [Halosegnis rubeus]KAB7519892.1 SDR family NAD(P)-dependent oxidoreductase [Halosegnis rubeus]